MTYLKTVTDEEEHDDSDQRRRGSDGFSLFSAQSDRNPLEDLQPPEDERVQHRQSHRRQQHDQQKGQQLVIVDEVRHRVHRRQVQMGNQSLLWNKSTKVPQKGCLGTKTVSFRFSYDHPVILVIRNKTMGFELWGY